MYHILYQCDNNYAPYAGVSIFSLLQHNQEIEDLQLHLLASAVSEENLMKIRRTCQQFSRDIIIHNCEELDERLESLGVLRYRGSYATFYKLFMDEFMECTEGRLLYMDSDTVIEGDLRPLLDMDMGMNAIAMGQDVLTYRYKRSLGFQDKEPYYNAGVILFDIARWSNGDYRERVQHHIQRIKSDYAKHEQDILNMTFKGEIATILQRYNVQSIFRALPPESFMRLYGKQLGYDERKLAEELDHIVVYHFLRFLGEFPWTEKSGHPYEGKFREYLRQSLWDESCFKKKEVTFIFLVERILYKILPGSIFGFLFKLSQEIMGVAS
ncbi:MAG: glycosyltransferase family 8 protein [Lachnospiraceae bacterium]|nr:glycosyltransferase family 8 protein [Lachnospiraceae bacterium]